MPGALSFTDVLADIKIIPDPRGTIEQVINHGFSSTYLNEELFPALRNKIADRIYNEALNLASNCGKPPVAKYFYTSRAKDLVNPDSMTYDFNGSLSYDEDEINSTTKSYLENYKFEWLIDEFVPLSGIYPIYTFQSEGIHKVELVVTDPDGNKSLPYVENIEIKKAAYCSGFDGNYPYAMNASLSTFTVAPQWFEIIRNMVSGVNDSTVYECKKPEPTRDVFNFNGFDISRFTQIPSSYPSPKIDYVGCVFDGRDSRALFKYDLDMSQMPEGVAFETLMFCAENNGNLRTDGRRVATVDNNSFFGDPQYISVWGKPFCYSYHPFMRNFFTSRKLPMLKVPLEDCSDCPQGMVKINGSCTCPAGYVPGGIGCQRESRCNSQSEFQTGNCACSKPYRVSSLSTNSPYYTCNTPPLPKNLPSDPSGQYLNPKFSGSLTFANCRTINGVKTFDLNHNFSNFTGSPIDVRAYCTDSQYGGSMFISTFSGGNFSGSSTYQPNGSCYKWKVFGFSRFAIVYESELNLPNYPFCSI